ncbi:MAG: hypothetical protein NTV19_13670 [Burkholderiales bacterium]|nr:hypothetical protein [Burkholderiales bacterium]
MKINPLARLSSMGRTAWLATLATFAGLCGVLAYWGVQLTAPRAPVAPATLQTAGGERPDLGPALPLFGQPPGARVEQAPVLGNVQVVGVVAAGRLGSAILIVDGKPARPFAVGDLLGPGQRVSSVRADLVVIDDNGRRAEVPAPARSSSAVLTGGPPRPRAAGDPGSSAPVPPANSPAGRPAPPQNPPPAPSAAVPVPALTAPVPPMTAPLPPVLAKPTS